MVNITGICNKGEKVYLSYYQSRFDNDVWQKMYYWHALPENWEEMNYQDFLLERRKRIAKVVKSAYQKL